MRAFDADGIMRDLASFSTREERIEYLDALANLMAVTPNELLKMALAITRSTLRCADCGAPMMSWEFDPDQPYCPACASGE